MSAKWKKLEDMNVWKKTMWEYVLFVFQIDEVKFSYIVRDVTTGDFIADSKKDNLFYETLSKAKGYAEIKAESEKINQLDLPS